MSDPWKTRVADVLVTCLEGGNLVKGGVTFPVAAGPKTMAELVKITGFREVTLRVGLEEARDRGDLVVWDDAAWKYKIAVTKTEINRYRRWRLKPIMTGLMRLRRILVSASLKMSTTAGVPDPDLDDIAFEIGQLADRVERVMKKK